MQKTKTCSHLYRKDRDVIYRMKQRGEKQEDIADTIGTSQSTVSRELKRNWQRTVRLSSCSRGMRCTRSLLTMALSFPSTRKSLRNWERRAIFTPLTTAGKKVELRTTTAWCVSTIQKAQTFRKSPKQISTKSRPNLMSALGKFQGSALHLNSTLPLKVRAKAAFKSALFYARWYPAKWMPALTAGRGVSPEFRSDMRK